MVKIPVLYYKLLRTIRSTRGQFISLSLVVTLGITVYVSMASTYANLYLSKDTFYKQCNFADHFYEVIRAPEQITRQIALIPGVAAVSGRIVQEVPVIREDGRRASARLYTYPLPLNTSLNQYYLLSGRQLDDTVQGGNAQVLVDSQYYKAHHLFPGSEIRIVANGKQIPVVVAGVGTSPEFCYPIKDAATMFGDPETFGIFMIAQKQAQPLLGMPGQINQISIKWAPGADRQQAGREIKSLLKPFGNLGDYPQKDQISDAFVRGELKQLKAQARMLPTIFLIIAVAVQYVMMGRMIKAQRLHIGIMKAIGYTSTQIVSHYTGYAIAIGLVGAALGSILGLWLAGAFSSLYAQYFNFPQAIGGLNYTALTKGIVLSLSVAVLSGIISTRGVVRINPAEALRSEPPKKGHAVWLESLPKLWQKLNSAWRMSLRAIGRNRGRFLVTLLGVICAIGLLVTSIFFKDTIAYMRQQAFFEEQRYDIMVRFKQPQDQRIVSDIVRLNGVVKGEPVMEVPVKIRVSGKTRQDLLQGLPQEVSLRKVTGINGQLLVVPEKGILISSQTANKLGVNVGDKVMVETMLGYGPKRVTRALVIGINQQIAGSTTLASLETVNQMLGERHVISGIMLKIDPGRLEMVERELADINGVSSVISRQKDLSNFDKNVETMAASIFILVTFALLLGFAIIYNSSVISFAERQRELATLRVMGMSIKEISSLLMKEVILYGLLGIMFGLPVGKLMANGLTKSVSTDLYQFSAVIYPSTYIWAAVMAVLFITVGHLLAVRGIRKLDMVEVLKNRD